VLEDATRREMIPATATNTKINIAFTSSPGIQSNRCSCPSLAETACHCRAIPASAIPNHLFAHPPQSEEPIQAQFGAGGWQEFSWKPLG
jgi:hypothetical protein